MISASIEVAGNVKRNSPGGDTGDDGGRLSSVDTALWGRLPDPGHVLGRPTRHRGPRPPVASHYDSHHISTFGRGHLTSDNFPQEIGGDAVLVRQFVRFYAGAHCHGYKPVNRSIRRINRSLGVTVDAFRKRADCCRRQPSNIASNTAGAGSR